MISSLHDDDDADRWDSCCCEEAGAARLVCLDPVRCGRSPSTKAHRGTEGLAPRR